jgi:ABC-type uncharacterized transport system permease subunit
MTSEKHGETQPNATASTAGNDFKLERYKYILNEIHALNENVNKYLTLFQTLATALIGGGVGLFLTWQSQNLDADLVVAAMRGLLGLLVILALFVVLVVVSGIVSWFDYRQEEVELLNEIVGPTFRKPPQWGNIWRWREFYVILFVLVSVGAIWWYVESAIIPLIR